jgi:hypothetical protein
MGGTRHDPRSSEPQYSRMVKDRRVTCGKARSGAYMYSRFHPSRLARQESITTSR